MADVAVSGVLVAGSRRRRRVLERRLIVAETLEAGASVARVALQHGVNANQVFQWRRLLRDGKLGAAPEHAMKLLPVSIDEEDELPPVVLVAAGAIHIELPGKIRISLEGSVDAATVCVVLKSLRS
jgi:transposase